MLRDTSIVYDLCTQLKEYRYINHYSDEILTKSQEERINDYVDERLNIEKATVVFNEYYQKELYEYNMNFEHGIMRLNELSHVSVLLMYLKSDRILIFCIEIVHAFAHERYLFLKEGGVVVSDYVT